MASSNQKVGYVFTIFENTLCTVALRLLLGLIKLRFNLLVNKHIETDDFMQFYPLLIHLASSPAERSPIPWDIARGNARGVREVPARPHAVRARTFCSDAPEA